MCLKIQNPTWHSSGLVTGTGSPKHYLLVPHIPEASSYSGKPTAGAPVTGVEAETQGSRPCALCMTPQLHPWGSLEHHHLVGSGLTWARMGLAVCYVVQEGPGTERESEKQGRWVLFCREHLRATPHLGEADRPPTPWRPLLAHNKSWAPKDCPDGRGGLSTPSLLVLLCLQQGTQEPHLSPAPCPL